jgi:hypothetical protein
VFGYFFREGAIKAKALDKYRRSVIYSEIEKTLDILHNRAITANANLAKSENGTSAESTAE